MDTIQKVNARYYKDDHYYKVLNWALKEKQIETYPQLTSSYRGARNMQYLMTLVNPLDLDKALKLAEPIALQCASDGVIITRMKDKVSFQVNLPESYWRTYHRGQHINGLGIGLTDMKQQIDYNFDTPHSIWIGTTGAGKTFGAKASLLALFDTYSPVEDLRCVICDYHGDMSDFQNEEHLFKFEWGTIADTLDTTVRAIKWTYNVLMKRIEDKEKDGIRILLFVDEVEAVAQYDKETLIRLVQIGNEGRKFNVNLMVTAKHPKEENLPGLMATLENRFVGKTTMGKQAMTRFVGQPIEARYLTDKGDFIHSNGDINRFLVAHISNSDIQSMKRTERQLVPMVDDKSVVFQPKQGRPEKPLDEELLAFLYTVGPDTFSSSLISKEWQVNASRIDKHKEFIKEFGKDYIRFRKVARKYPEGLHPRLFNEYRRLK